MNQRRSYSTNVERQNVDRRHSGGGFSGAGMQGGLQHGGHGMQHNNSRYRGNFQGHHYQQRQPGAGN